ncbi:PQQ-like beta-propeller repeat protein [Kordiimonas laminariae]|uniref:PQQ-like beta-propeller repeat protein n=1 Tax=Kordiimonas laminariae TaxID=2917717 RepID=UPI001FF47E93|nr:PQQ-like beta-propeller repeat protein [Kordiimonas laminariae]MCK0069910.1 PQQ-like beta-propeller repeat protein [Kordiimonas laminariae]
MTTAKLLSKTLKIGLLGATALTIAACSSSKKQQKYDDEGRERISILTGSQGIAVDSTISTLPIVLPRPYRNQNWAQAGGNAQHITQHLELGDNLSKAWSTSIGRGNEKYERLVSGPVAGNGLVFAVDIKSQVTAVSLASGSTAWSVDLSTDEERSKVGFGGGAALFGDTLYVTSGYGFLVALDASTGREKWRYSGAVPFRGAPTAAENRVFAVTHDNQMLAFDTENGELLWDQVGISENAGMLGAASPAYDGTTFVAALSSGELIAMLGSNGRILWQDALSSSRRLTPLATLSDIDGHPVIDRGRVYAVSHAGRMVAIDMRTGERSWEADVAGVNTPTIAGRFGFVTTIDGQVACVSLDDGRVRWVTQLQRFTNQDKRRGLIRWNGPVLAGDRLLVTSTHGFALSVSPYTGEVLSGIEMDAGSSTEPIVVDGTFIVLADDGELIAYR